jgi:uncharacterized DUF497 family protein
LHSIEAIEIDDHILDKIESKHGVSFDEAEAACISDGKHVRRGREGLYKIFNRIFGRYLLVVLADKGDGVYKIVTAREMSDTERKLYDRVQGR